MWGDRAVPAWHRNLGAAPRWQGDEAGADVEATDSPDKQTTGPASSPGTGAKVWGHGQGDRVPVGLLGVMRKLWERSCPQTAAPGLGSGTRVIVGPFPLWNPPPHTHPHPEPLPAPSPTPSESLSSSPSLPASVSPAEGRDGALLLRSPRQSRTHPLGTSSPGRDQVPRAPRCPGGLPCPAPSPRAGGSIGVWEVTGPGHRSHPEPPRATLLLLQFLSDQLPGTKG